MPKKNKIADLKTILSGGDLRSIGRSNSIIKLIKSQSDFDKLFELLSSKDRIVIMRSADAIEKIILTYPEYLTKHKKDVIKFCYSNLNIEFKWHLAILLSRLEFTYAQSKQIWKLLAHWALDKNESKIVRVNSLQSLFHLYTIFPEYISSFCSVIENLKKENIPSINARIRKFDKTN